jgi:hypothetical protein
MMNKYWIIDRIPARFPMSLGQNMAPHQLLRIYDLLNGVNNLLQNG